MTRAVIMKGIVTILKNKGVSESAVGLFTKLAPYAKSHELLELREILRSKKVGVERIHLSSTIIFQLDIEGNSFERRLETAMGGIANESGRRVL